MKNFGYGLIGIVMFLLVMAFGSGCNKEVKGDCPHKLTAVIKVYDNEHNLIK